MVERGGLGGAEAVLADLHVEAAAVAVGVEVLRGHAHRRISSLVACRVPAVAGYSYFTRLTSYVNYFGVKKFTNNTWYIKKKPASARDAGWWRIATRARF